MTQRRDFVPARINYLHLLILASVLLVYIGLSLGAAGSRAPHEDEGNYACPAFNLLYRGFLGNTVIDPRGVWGQRELKGIHEHVYWAFPLHFLAQVPWYAAFGFGFFQMRSLSVFWASLLLLACYSIARKLTADPQVALLAFVLLALDGPFGIFSTDGRPDTMAASLGFAGLAAYLSLRETNLRVAVAVGHTLAAASLFTHPNGVIAILGLLFLCWYLDRHAIHRQHLAVALIPYAVGGALFGYYILLSPADFLAQTGANTRARFMNPLAAIWYEPQRYLDYGGRTWIFGFTGTLGGKLKILVPLSWAAALIAILATKSMRRQRGVAALLCLTAISYGVLLFFNLKFANYLIYVIPLLDINVAVCIAYCWTNRSIPRALTAFGVTLFLGTSLLIPVYRLTHTNTYRDNYLPAVEYLRKHIAEGEVVFGPAGLDFGLGIDHVIHDETLGYYSRKVAPYVVIDSGMEAHFSEMHKPRPDLWNHVTNLLARNYRLVYDHAEYKIYEHLTRTAAGVPHSLAR